jgi:hypothetical protein
MIANQGFDLPLIFYKQSAILIGDDPSYHVAARRQSPQL